MATGMRRREFLRLAAAGGGGMALAGLLAYTLWYAVHALGVNP